MINKRNTLAAALGIACALALGSVPASAQQGKKLTIALPGIPPIFSVTIAYVAEKEGFFKKHGANYSVAVRHELVLA
jgi:ABC-type nitrate/sulfonate/bicarbonate transport system substrate-binding protein